MIREQLVNHQIHTREELDKGRTRQTATTAKDAAIFKVEIRTKLEAIF